MPSLAPHRTVSRAAAVVAALAVLLAGSALAADNTAPVVTIDVTSARGDAPLEAAFSGAATDADEDAVAYSWDFGVPGAPGATGRTAAFRYDQPGVYTVTLRATDARGATGTATTTVTADEPAPACVTARSDTFAGRTLDASRWTVVRPSGKATVAGGALHLTTTPTDLYGTGVVGGPRLPDGGTTPALTPDLVLQPVPAGTWTATTTLTLAARHRYQQAGLVLYGDDDQYAKLVLQARGTDDASQRIVQLTREVGGYPTETNTPVLGAAFPDTVHLRLTGDATTVTGAYSPDGLTWTTLAAQPTAGIANPRIGLLALAGPGAPPVDAAFASFALTPDLPSAGDEFSGTSLATATDTPTCARWSLVRPERSAYRVRDGGLEIDTSAGDIYGTGNTGPTNLVLQPAPSGDWTMETKVDASTFDSGFQNAGLLVYADDANYLKLDYVTENASSARLEMRAELNDRVLGEVAGRAVTGGVWYLRIVKSGLTYTGSTSRNGTTWTPMGTMDASLPFAQPLAGAGRVGVYAWGGPQTARRTATFDWFHLTRAA